MRIAFAVPLLLLAACEANVDQANDSVTFEYDQNLAENTVDTVTNEAQEIGGQIANDVEQTADRVDNRVDIDVDVNDGGNEAAPAQNNQ